MEPSHFDNENASMGSLFGTLIAIFFCGLVWDVLGMVFQYMNGALAGLNLAQDAVNTMTFLEVAFQYAVPIILLLFFVFNHMINSKNDANMGRV
jgi:hypothetical protein